MAVSRLSLANIKNELLRIAGNYASSSEADWQNDAALYRLINAYGQRLAARTAMVSRDFLPPQKGTIKFDMWKTVANSSTDTTSTGLVVTVSSNVIHLPVNLDVIISLYDTALDRRVDKLTDTSKFHARIKEKSPGPPQVYEEFGYATLNSNWRRAAYCWPTCLTGDTYALELTYYRLPAIMSGDDGNLEYPDCDPKYQSLWIYGPAMEILRPDNPAYSRYQALENELLVDLAHTARFV